MPLTDTFADRIPAVVSDEMYSSTWSSSKKLPTERRVYAQMETKLGAVAVGMPIGSGGANRVLYENGSQNLAAISTFVFDGSKLGIGVSSPSAKVHVISTTEQLRLGYDVSNYFTTTVASNGAVTFDLVSSSPKFLFNSRVEVSSADAIQFGDFTGGIGSNAYILVHDSDNKIWIFCAPLCR